MRKKLELSTEERIARRNRLARNRYYKHREEMARNGYYEILRIAISRFIDKVQDGIKEAEQNHGETVAVNFTPDVKDLVEELVNDKRFKLIYKEGENNVNKK